MLCNLVVCNKVDCIDGLPLTSKTNVPKKFSPGIFSFCWMEKSNLDDSI